MGNVNDLNITVINVVDEILRQYIAQLKQHKNKSMVEILSKRIVNADEIENNTIKCQKGINFANSVKENLGNILFRKRGWTRKELMKKYHPDCDISIYCTKNLGYCVKKDIANNVFMSLDTMGISVGRLMPAILGYAYIKKCSELYANGTDNSVTVQSGSFGKLTVNYGMPIDFNVLSGENYGPQFVLDLDKVYNIISEYLNTCQTSATSKSHQKFDIDTSFYELSKLLCEPGVIYDYESGCYQYQQAFEMFRKNMLGRIIYNIYGQYELECSGLVG